MNFTELIKNRYSVRAYDKNRMVEKEKLDFVLEAFRLAPTAANQQPFKLIVIQTKGKENELRKIYDREWFVSAPLIICGCILKDKGWKRGDGMNYSLVDLTIAFDHLVLAATELGLGTCWIADFDPSAAKKALSLPENLAPIIFTPLGYPLDSPRPKIRKIIEELVEYY